MESQFLKSVFKRITEHVRKSLKKIDENEVKLYSRTLVKFVDSLTHEEETKTIRKGLINTLRKELGAAVKYPSWKPFIQLQQVSRLSLENFGSSVMGTSMRDSDLDISIDGFYRYRKLDREIPLSSATREIQALLLNDMLRFLKEKKRVGHQNQPIVILGARVPILRYTDRRFGIQCDFSIGNEDATSRSKALAKLIASDERIRILIVLAKKWAKAYKLNDPSQGSFGSYALTIMTLAFCKDKGILPTSFSKQTKKAKPENKESLLELMLCLFSCLAFFLSRESLFLTSNAKIFICCRNGSILDAPESMKFGKSVIFVRDPFTKDSNCAKPVTSTALFFASKTLQRNLLYISNFLKGSSQDRKHHWNLLFQSLFLTRVRFKGIEKSLLEEKKQGINEVLEGSLAGIFDELIERFLSYPHSKKNIPTGAFENWFLLKLQRKYIASNSALNSEKPLHQTLIDDESLVM